MMESKPLSTAKGFVRLMFDLSNLHGVVEITTTAGIVYEGSIVSFEGDVLTVATQIDRFNVRHLYMPTSSICAIRTEPFASSAVEG